MDSLPQACKGYADLQNSVIIVRLLASTELTTAQLSPILTSNIKGPQFLFKVMRILLEIRRTEQTFLFRKVLDYCNAVILGN